MPAMQTPRSASCTAAMPSQASQLPHKLCTFFSPCRKRTFVWRAQAFDLYAPALPSHQRALRGLQQYERLGETRCSANKTRSRDMTTHCWRR
ncbi:hypothetical protein FW800_19015 [Pseudomonas sp. 910_23]